jgi:hypothetical protein
MDIDREFGGYESLVRPPARGTRGLHSLTSELNLRTFGTLRSR